MNGIVQKEKLIYQMYIVENMTAEEISEETGYSLRQIKKYISQFGFYKRKK